MESCTSGEKNHLHSPDQEYQPKILRVCQCVEEARTHNDVITLYEDEFTFYEIPTVANGWEMRGKAQPLARLGYSWERKCRIAGVLNAVDGSVINVQSSKIGVKELEKFYEQIRRHYPFARKIYLIMDNWPIHYHPKVVKAAEINNIQLIPLPTYAPWTNPIEKLWRWLYQDVLHLHRYAGDWELLIRRECTFLDKFQNGSQELLRYVGLSEGRIPASPPDWKMSVEQREAIPELCDDILHNVSRHDKLLI